MRTSSCSRTSLDIVGSMIESRMYARQRLSSPTRRAAPGKSQKKRKSSSVKLKGMGQQPYEQEAPDARSMATFAHISPVLSLFAPLIFWFIYKDKTGYGRTKAAAARAFNLALTWTIVAIVYIIVCAVIFGAGAAASTARNVSPLVGIASPDVLADYPCRSCSSYFPHCGSSKN